MPKGGGKEKNYKLSDSHSKKKKEENQKVKKSGENLPQPLPPHPQKREKIYKKMCKSPDKEVEPVNKEKVERSLSYP